MSKQLALTFGRQVRLLRRKRGVTQRQLAEEIGMDWPLYSKVENDRVPPPDDEMVRRMNSALEWVESDLLALAHQPFVEPPPMDTPAFICGPRTPAVVDEGTVYGAILRNHYPHYSPDERDGLYWELGEYADLPVDHPKAVGLLDVYRRLGSPADSQP